MSRQYSPYSTIRERHSAGYRSEYATDDWYDSDGRDTYDAYGTSEARAGYTPGYTPGDYTPRPYVPREHSYADTDSETDTRGRRSRRRDDAEADADYPDYEFPADYHDALDRRWIWVAGVAGVILMIAVICTGVILGGGDSGTVTAGATTSADAEPSAAAQPSATAAPSASAPAPGIRTLPPETVTTVTPTPSATATPTLAPAPAPTAPAPVVVPEAPVPDPALAARTVTYHVTGNRQLIDLVTVIYTDQQGALQTEVNVALPWVKTVTLDPGVSLSSVTATSVGGQLNCSIVDGSGAAVAVQANNSMIATCTR